jgi:hypothetical protein
MTERPVGFKTDEIGFKSNWPFGHVDLAISELISCARASDVTVWRLVDRCARNRYPGIAEGQLMHQGCQPSFHL